MKSEKQLQRESIETDINSKPAVKSGLEQIAEERKRQIEVEGWNNPHDEGHKHMELSGAAGCYLANALNKQGYKTRFQIHVEPKNSSGNKLLKKHWYDGWPWDSKWDKRHKHDYKRSLVIAGALIAAELDRLNSIDAVQASVATDDDSKTNDD